MTAVSVAIGDDVRASIHGGANEPPVCASSQRQPGWLRRVRQGGVHSAPPACELLRDFFHKEDLEIGAGLSVLVAVPIGGDVPVRPAPTTSIDELSRAIAPEIERLPLRHSSA